MKEAFRICLILVFVMALTSHVTGQPSESELRFQAYGELRATVQLKSAERSPALFTFEVRVDGRKSLIRVEPQGNTRGVQMIEFGGDGRESYHLVAFTRSHLINA